MLLLLVQLFFSFWRKLKGPPLHFCLPAWPPDHACSLLLALPCFTRTHLVAVLRLPSFPGKSWGISKSFGVIYLTWAYWVAPLVEPNPPSIHDAESRRLKEGGIWQRRCTQPNCMALRMHEKIKIAFSLMVQKRSRPLLMKNGSL